ncbi:MAG: DUF4290 domain-containing protein [Bacteroidales bacterium]|jgi:hypothetical protein|nr:DUF4290 domain-containing protein [Bacteroidales bacterium]
MSFDYNTSRKQLVLPEYGRNIQKMVDYIKTVEDRTERNRLAGAIISIMGNLNPHLRDINDFKHKLWDHLAIIADFELDIDYPYEIPKAEMFKTRPRPVEYGTHSIKYRHYGKSLELMIDAVCDMQDETEKERLINVVANHMKKSYLTWNRDTVNDEVILNDLKKLSKGRINTENIKLNETREIIGKKRSKRNIRKK